MERLKSKRSSDVKLDKVANKYLEKNPDVKELLDLFGVTYDQYKTFVVAQQGPVFITTGSTI